MAKSRIRLGNSDDICLLELIYLDLKNEVRGNKQDIFKIVLMVGKLRSLNCELYETADEIGRLSFVKSNLAGDVNELTKMIYEFDVMQQIVFSALSFQDGFEVKAIVKVIIKLVYTLMVNTQLEFGTYFWHCAQNQQWKSDAITISKPHMFGMIRSVPILWS